MHSFFQDVRYAFQQARKNPGLNATAVISLALGIAASMNAPIPAHANFGVFRM